MEGLRKPDKAYSQDRLSPGDFKTEC